ncbi:M12 family metallo-peptidase [Pantoea sp. App145]|uniref:M12 family metallo-peptidase n=1 Tax=Pantoea sp. App145 TaxID=3071567 RepID=UPI003A7F8874
MLIFKKKFLFAVIASALSSSVFAAPPLFSIVDENVNYQDAPLLRSFQEEHKDYKLVNINRDVLLGRSGSFLFKADGEPASAEIRATSLQKDHAGIEMWHGSSEDEQSTATFAINGANITGGIRLNNGSFYEIYPVAQGLHALVKIDTSHISADEHDDVWDETSTAKQQAFNEQLNNHEHYNTSSEPAKIKILYIYTNQTRAKFQADPTGYASYLTDELNISHARSETFAQFESVGAVDSKMNEATMNTMLHQMDNPSTALGKLVAEKTAATRADLVVLISHASELCGTAKSWSPWSVVNVECAVSNRTLAHETGHNFGLKHNEDEATWPAYANGYSVPGKFRTIMSKTCSPSCPKIDYFSTPYKSSHGLPVGTAASNDAVRHIKETRFNVASYYPDWESQRQLNDGDLPQNQYFEISLTENATNKKIIRDEIVTRPGLRDWPYDISIAVNKYFPNDVIMAGGLDTNIVKPIVGTSYQNHIWLHQDKIGAYKVDVQRKTYAVVRNNNWGDAMAISGGDGLAASATVMLTIKNKTSGQALEKYYFNNGDQSLGGSSWPHHLAQIINGQNSSNVLAGELKDGNFNTVTGSVYRNLLWFPLDKKKDLTAEFTTLTIAENPWLKEENVFGDKFQTDLTSGSVITVTVKNSNGTVAEQRSVAIPADSLSRYDWPPYLAREVNANLTQIKMAEKTGDNSFVVIAGSQYRNYIWKKERANQTVVVTFSK